MEDVKTETVVKEQPKKKSGLRKFLWRFSLIAILVLAFLVYWFYFNVSVWNYFKHYVIRWNCPCNRRCG